MVAHTKSVLGVHFDPFHDDRLLTFSEDGMVKLWDVRKMTESVRRGCATCLRSLSASHELGLELFWSWSS